MQVEIIEKIPSAEEYNEIRESVGWGIYELNVSKNALPNSLYSVCAYADSKLIGMARIIGDHGLVFYIQDLIVIPEYQNKGIGTQLMKKVMDYVENHANHNSVIGLMSAKGKEKFYERFGFINRPNENLGSGMTIFWKKNKKPSNSRL
jgi:GNAT superfamily N-acetyltransferase